MCDQAGHIMFTTDPYVLQLYDMLLGDNVHWQDREAWIYSKETYTRYPFQGALYGLPPEVIKECIVGAIEARFGSVTAKPGVAEANPPNHRPSSPHGHLTHGHHHRQGGHGGVGQGHSHGIGLAEAGAKALSVAADRGNQATVCDVDSIADCCADGIMESTAPLTEQATGPVTSVQAPEN